MQCLKCNGHGIIRKDGQVIAVGEQCSIRQLVELYDPCDLCKDGEKEAVLFRFVRTELSSLITKPREGTTLSQRGLTRIGI